MTVVTEGWPLLTDVTEVWLLLTFETEGWPLLTVGTEVNGDSQSTNERNPSLVGSLGLSCQYKGFCSALADLSGQEQNIVFLTLHYFNSFFPHRIETDISLLAKICKIEGEGGGGG